MKEQAILKINKVGKYSAIVAIICRILLIMGMVISLLGLVLCLILPKDLVKVSTAGTMRMKIDYGVFGIDVFEEELRNMEEMKDWMAQGGDVRVDTVQSVVGVDGLTLSADGQTYIPTSVTVEDGVVTMDMTSGEVSIGIRDVAVLIALAMVSVAMTLVTVIFAERLCKAFRDCQSPFEENVIKKMQQLAVALIPWTVVSSIAESVLNSAVSNRMQWSFSLDMGVVLVVLIVLVLVYIFRYGAVLQQESDETL